MPKEVILYNLRDDVKEEDYKKWCEDYKGPLLLGLHGSKSFAPLRIKGGVQGNGQEGNAPNPTASPFNYIGILDVTSLENWGEARESKAFKEEFFPQWFSKWVADFYILGGVEVYYGESQ